MYIHLGMSHKNTRDLIDHEANRSVIRSLSTAATTLREHPIILLGALLFVIVSDLAYLPRLGVPMPRPVAPIIQAISILAMFILPFVIAGFIGMINAGIDGSTNVRRLFNSGRSNYVSMLGATVVFVLLMTVFGTGLAIIINAIGAGFAVPMFIGSIVLRIDIQVGVISVIGLLVVVFLQFFAAAIVVSDARAIRSFSRSAGLVQQNFRSVLGYTLIFALLSFLPRVLDIALFMMAVEEFPDPAAGQIGYVIASEPLLALSVVLAVILGTLATAFAWTYYVAYYRSLLSDTTGTAAQATTTPETSEDTAGSV